LPLDNPYLKLLRIPNIFTVPGDIIVGFLVALVVFQSSSVGLSHFNTPVLFILIFSSITIYLGGLVSNDLFDIKIDKVDRPTRPLPSGKVQKKHAIILLTCLFGIGFLLSLLVHLIATVICGILVLSILLYNYKLKAGILRPFLMGGIRSLNVFYGFSSLFGYSDQGIKNTGLQTALYNIDPGLIALLTLVLASVFFHVFVLTWVSSKETDREFVDKSKKIFSVKAVYYIYVTFLLIISVSGFYLVPYPVIYAFFILALGIVVTLIFNKARRLVLNLHKARGGEKGGGGGGGPLAMQFIVKNMLLLLILLDSAFIAGLSGVIAGIATALFILPSIYLAKKISMT
jgi:4-hydroxybenzoate polyprenyltransferase